MVKLSASGTLSELSREIASQLFASATICRLNSGDMLFQAGDRGDGCFRLDTGLLKVSLISPQVKEQIIAILTPGAIVGDLSAADGLARSASVVALTKCELRFVNGCAFEAFALEHPEIHQYLIKLLATRLRQAHDTIAALAFLPVKARVARALLTLAENFGAATDAGGTLIPHMLSQRDIAAMAGVARENTNRILSEWERSKVISKFLGSYRIDDKGRLEREMVG